MAEAQLKKGIEANIPSSYKELEDKCRTALDRVLAKYPKARKMYDLIRNDPEVNGCWDAGNYIAVTKLHYNDHGDTHALVVASNGVQMLQMLVDAGLKPDTVASGAGDIDDAFLVVAAGGSLHDIGNQVEREEHNLFSTFLAVPILSRLLPQIYGDDWEKIAEIRGFILHTIYAHPYEIEDHTIEAALVGIGDGTDLTKGRGRMAFELGQASIHTISALSIESLEISKGKDRPIRLFIELNNSAGVFQIEETLAKKIKHGPLEPYIDIVAATVPRAGDKDHRIVYEVTVKDGKIMAKGE